MQQTTIKRLTRQFPQYFTIVVHTSHTWGRVRLPKRMKTSKVGVFFNPKIYFADFGPLLKAFFGRFPK